MNNLNKKYFQIATDVAKKLSIISKNQFILVIGSVANQIVDEYSDIDIVVFYDKEPSEKKLSQSLNIPHAKKFWLDATKFHVHYNTDSIDTTTLFINLDYVKKLIRKIPDISLDEFAVLSRYVADGKLLHGYKQEFQNWKKICKIIPEKIKNDVIYHRMSSLNFWFKQGNLIQLAKRSDWLMVNRTINHSIEWLLTVLYLINDKVYINPKRSNFIINNFKIKPENIVQKLENLYLIKNALDDVERKVQSMISIMDETEKLIENQ